MEIRQLFEKWKLNQAMFSDKIQMPKTTFSLKLEGRRGSSSIKEQQLIKKNLTLMARDMEKCIKRYPIDDSGSFSKEDDIKVKYRAKKK